MGAYLLVIPTGGGKTFTAVKAINRLFEARDLEPAARPRALDSAPLRIDHPGGRYVQAVRGPLSRLS